MTDSLKETLTYDSDHDSSEDDEYRSDGGVVESPFEVVSEYEETRREKFRKFYDTYVFAPLAIIWKDWRARIGSALLLGYLLMATVGPMVVPETVVYEGPALVQPFQSWQYPLGTDDLGRDLFAQTVYSSRTVLKMVASGAFLTVFFGTVVGAVAGYKGGTVDTVLSSIMDILINIPGFPLVMVLTLMLPVAGNPWAVGAILSIAAWGGLGRSIRSQVLTLRNESFVEASRAMGMPTRTIVSKDIVPHLMSYVLINFTRAARRVIFEAVALYYLGVLPFRDLNWGVMLKLAYQAGAHYRPEAYHWFFVPMFAITGLAMALILLSQSLDRVFNPRVRARHEKTTADEVGSDEDATITSGGGL